LNIELGTVFRWINFPSPRHQKSGNNNKPRWFICVGFSGEFAQVAVAYLCTTTTQIEKFQSGGVRSGRAHFVFKTSQFKFFEEDCVIDFDEAPYSMRKEQLKAFESDIEIRGTLDEQTLRMIYNQLLRSRFISSMELQDIHDSFNMAGISGLKKPKRTR
jgi:hypothetical protein